MADLRRIVAVIPVRSLRDAKSRLGEPLDPEERQALVVAFLRRSVAAAREARSVAGVTVVSNDPELLELAAHAGAARLLQRTEGLNEGLSEAVSSLAGATAILVLPADLPAVSGAEIDRIVSEAGTRASSGRGLAALVPDRHGSGTNVLLLSPPDAIPFRFGEGSRRLHAEEAARAGAEYVELDGPLTFDVDTPEDLLLAEMGGLEGEGR